MSYIECVNQAEIISKKIHLAFGRKGDFEKSFFVEFPDVEKVQIHNPVLVLGLNPSGSTDKPRECPNLFLYIPQINRHPNTLPKRLLSQIKKTTYPTYFKTYIELFQKLTPPYNPLWYNADILKEILDKKENEQFLNDELKTYLRHSRQSDNEKYIVFADLIQYTETDSKTITPFLDNEEIAVLVKKYIKFLLDFLKPMCVLSANAFVSNYLVKQFNDSNKDCTHINIDGTTVFLASMLTGQRAMDTFSRERLFNEIKAFMSSDKFTPNYNSGKPN